LHLFIRDHSINLVRNELCGGSFYDVRPAPDIALFMNKSAVKHDRSGVVLCFRPDKESVNNVKVIDAIQSQAAEFGEPVRRVDTVVSHEVSLKARERELDQILTEFCRTRLVITDRLHGMIFSAITGTPCIALNNSSGKVGGVWSLWLQHLPYVKFVDSAGAVLSLIPEMLAMGGQRYDQGPFESYWQEIANVMCKED
jgi:pyruvyl transferase EpsI